MPARPILVATDLSPGSDLALITGSALASSGGVSLHVFHCVPEPPLLSWSAPAGEAERQRWAARARDEVTSQVERIFGSAGGPHLSMTTAVGHPTREILREAADRSADLIVLGAHEPRPVLDTLLGGTAERIIRSAEVPCLAANSALSPSFSRVLIPLDFSPPSERALHAAVDLIVPLLADRPERRAVLELVHVSAFASPHARSAGGGGRLEEVASELRERLGGVEISVEARVLSMPTAAEGIARSVEESGPDLVVLGTHGYSGLGRALIGSVATVTVRTIRCPVMLVPPDPLA
jgi:universal stress protein E